MIRKMIFVLLLFTALSATGQVKYDEGAVYVQGLTFLQSSRDPMEYQYLPQFPRLATRPDGTFEFLGINTSIKPPMVSIPSDNGVISSNKKSLLLPAKISACTAAPSATTSSGFTETFAGFLKNFSTDSFTNGTRVLPPTITISFMSLTEIAASSSLSYAEAMTRRQMLAFAAAVPGISPALPIAF